MCTTCNLAMTSKMILALNFMNSDGRAKVTLSDAQASRPTVLGHVSVDRRRRPLSHHPQRLAERAVETQLAPYLRNVNIAI